MSFRDLELNDTYRSNKHKLLDDFYLPALREARFYDRAVGFFSSSLLIYALEGISSIIKNNGKMRLIIGKVLTDEEYEAAKNGHELASVSEIFNKELDEILEVKSHLEKYRLRLFTAMIATGKLEIKFAYRPSGMYHEKIGIIRDADGNKILFYGSANETTKAINSNHNFESFNVYKSWEPDIYKRFAYEYEEGFEDIWSGADKSIVTVSLPSSLYDRLHEYHLEHPPEVGQELLISEQHVTTADNNYPLVPDSIQGRKFELFEHQKLALRAWFDNDRTGLLQLATGAGKTITSLYGVSKMFEVSQRPRTLLFIVAVPYVALAEQWVDELSMFNMRPVKCFSSKTSWDKKLTNKVNNLLSGNIEFVSIIVVNKTLATASFQNVIKRVHQDFIFFVGDECHRHGTELISQNLPIASYKMGLSATPYDDAEPSEYEEQDDTATAKDRITGYYGDVVAEYGLQDALLDEVLTPYNYYLNVVYLTERETELYIRLSKTIGRLIAISSSKDNNALNNAIRKRNKIISNAEGKLRVLDGILKSNLINEKSNTLFYVGEGRAGIDDDEDDFRDNTEDESSQLDEVAKVIKKNGWKVSAFTAKESKADRKKIMNSFVDGSIDGLVSMRVLDEGIDIPKCQRAFILASSRNKRQFIQRRGRILRRFKGKKLAHIYDFFVVPSLSLRDKSCISLVENELRRAMDFVFLSNNRNDCMADAKEVAGKFQIDVMELKL